MSFDVPQGFRFAAVHCGIKRDASRPDLTFIACDKPATAAGVYTQNLVCAAPVILDRSRTPSASIRAVVINSGNANACTGEQGDRDALQMAHWGATAIGARPEESLIMSTGIIGHPMPMDKIRAGIESAVGRLAGNEAALQEAAWGIMTTDLVPKLATRRLEVDGQTVRIAGIAKGSGMIGPRMATLLGVIMTDAALDPQSAQQMLSRATEDSFNSISVDGHTSTNDTVLLLASGAASLPGGLALAALEEAVNQVCQELARAVAADGEGATHLITIDVRGCRAKEEARRIARTVAESPLVKTAVAGGDPNWGRIVSAAGYAGVSFDPVGVSLHLNGHPLYRHGQPLPFDRQTVSDSIRASRDTHIELEFSSGDAECRFWTSDLTAEYVRINADYFT